MNRKIGFIGAGKLASALAQGLLGHGYAVMGVASRSLTSASALASKLEGCKAFPSPQALADEAGLVFITTPDDVIPIIASQVRWKQGQWVVHCSGADSVEVLSAAEDQGAIAGAFHPLQSFASSQESDGRFRGIMFALEGEGELLDFLKEMACALGGRWVLLNTQDKVLYHLSAAMASNYLVTLTAMASGLWERFGSTGEEGVRALLPLMRGTLDNIEKAGIPACLTGPIARGDEGTLVRHLMALPPELSRAYCEMGLQTVPIALAKGGIDEQKANSMRHLLRGTALKKPFINRGYKGTESP